MGTFRVEIQAVGGHGCQRERKDGTTVDGCGQPSCPDCITREYVKNLKRSGAHFQKPLPGMSQPSSDGYARLIHWPGQPGEVVDDLLTGARTGSF